MENKESSSSMSRSGIPFKAPLPSCSPHWTSLLPLLLCNILSAKRFTFDQVFPVCTHFKCSVPVHIPAYNSSNQPKSPPHFKSSSAVTLCYSGGDDLLPIRDKSLFFIRCPFQFLSLRSSPLCSIPYSCTARPATMAVRSRGAPLSTISFEIPPETYNASCITCIPLFFGCMPHCAAITVVNGSG